MNNFSVIYKILHMLEKAMDYDEFDLELISAENLKISEQRLNAILEMMVDNGYIAGVEISNYLNGEKKFVIRDMRITLKGLEYLHENKLMKKAARTAKGIIAVIK